MLNKYDISLREEVAQYVKHIRKFSYRDQILFENLFKAKASYIEK